MKSAVIVVDMLNPYDHPDAGLLMESVRATLPGMCDLVARARDGDVPVIYVNDNHEDWSAGRPELVERALRGRAPELVEPIVPSPDLAFVVKARHSIFYETQTEYLLRRWEIGRIVLVGQVTEQCILYSALDAYVRHFAVTVPRDAVAEIRGDLADAALRMMARNMHADITSAADCTL
jgi:nicotinamidase-related amidase